jgi:hypothetical protein
VPVPLELAGVFVSEALEIRGGPDVAPRERGGAADRRRALDEE